MLVSILCAVFVSVTNTIGLGTMLPIMCVLVKGDTIATWADRELVQRRLGVKFTDETNDLVLVKVDPGGAAFGAGLRDQSMLVAGLQNSGAEIAQLLADLSNPANCAGASRPRSR